MKDDFDEEAFEKSIESIVDEETADAQLYVNKNIMNVRPETEGSIQDEPGQTDSDDSDYEYDDDLTAEKQSSKKTVIIVVCVAAAVIIIGVVAFFVIRTALSKTKDNYGYYNSMGYEALDNKDYEAAITSFEKALTYNEGKTADTTNINMMLYLYDCYMEVGDEDKAVRILKDVLERDKYNKSACYYLIEIYDKKKDYKSIHELYESMKESNDEELMLYFSNYAAQVPSVSPAGDTYQADQELTLSAPEGYKIYYTLDGSDPTKSASLYRTGEKLPVTEGDTTLKFFAMNEYGFESDVVTAKYTVEYSGPVKPTINPSNTEINQEEKAKVVISGTQAGSTVYYTIDGSMPTTTSLVYTGPFELPAGTVTVSVLVVDSHGKTANASKTYNVRYTSKYSDSQAAEFVWNALTENLVVDENHCDAAGRIYELNYYSSKQINGSNMYLFYCIVDGTTQGFYYGADGDTGEVFTITGDDGNFAVTPLE